MAEEKKWRVPVWKHRRFVGIWRKAEEAWRSPDLGNIAAAIFFLLCGWLHWHLPPSILAITLLTIAVAFMGLRGEMGGREKWIWFVIVLLYAGLTIRADNSERRKAEKELTDNFSALSRIAKDNLHASLDDSGVKFAGLLQNQNQQFQAMLTNQKAEFSETLESLHRQEHEQEDIKSAGEDARLNTQLIASQLEATRTETSRQTPIPSASTSTQKPLPPPEPRAIKELKVQALQLAKAIDDWISLESKHAQGFVGSIPHTAEEGEKLKSYMDHLNKEWNDKFNRPADSMVSELQIHGLVKSCNGRYLFNSPSEVLEYRGICASAIQHAALDLK
jgi:hypothetical protein